MRGFVEAFAAFILGSVVGVGYLWTAGDLTPKAEAATPGAVAPPPVAAPPPPAPTPAPAEPAPAATPPTPEPGAVATTTSTPPPAEPPKPAEPAEPMPAYGYLLVTGLGNDVSMHHFEKGELKGKKVKYPVEEQKGEIEIKSKNGPWTVTLSYKNQGKALGFSILGVEPLAIISLDGQPQGTTLAGQTIAPGKNVNLTFNGGPSVPEFKVVLSYKR
jgi:hypothetical protein